MKAYWTPAMLFFWALSFLRLFNVLLPAGRTQVAVTDFVVFMFLYVMVVRDAAARTLRKGSR